VFVDNGSGGITFPAGLLFYDDGTSPAASAARGHQVLADPTRAPASTVAKRADLALVSLNTIDGTGYQPATASVLVGPVPGTQPHAGTNLSVVSHQTVDHRAEGESSTLSLAGLDGAELL